MERKTINRLPPLQKFRAPKVPARNNFIAPVSSKKGHREGKGAPSRLVNSVIHPCLPSTRDRLCRTAYNSICLRGSPRHVRLIAKAMCHDHAVTQQAPQSPADRLAPGRDSQQRHQQQGKSTSTSANFVLHFLAARQ